MANTGNTQQIINYGSSPNDGTGDPLRTAFIKTDENFSNIWDAGPVGSNISIANNTIQNDATNANIIIKPNGTGVIQANASILPNASNLRDLGSSSQKFRAAYIGTGGITVDGNVTVAGNLTAGNISYTGNVFVGDLQGSVYADDSTIMVDAIDNEMFASAATFGLATVTGNVSANYFVGNGSLLTGIASTYGNANVAEYLTTYDGNLSANNISAGNVFTARDILATTGSFNGDSRGRNSLYAGVPLFTVLGSDVVAQFSGNVNSYTQFNFQNGNSGPLATGDYVITADNGTDSTYFVNLGLGGSNHADPAFFGDSSSPNDAYLYVVGADATGPGDTGPGNLIIGSTNGVIKFFVGNTAQANVVQTITSSGVSITGNIIPSANAVYSLGNATNYWSNLWVANNTIYIGGVPLGITAGNVLTVNGEAVLSNDSDATITTTGNITADYFFGNGSQLTGLSTGSISNGTSNVEIVTANGNVTINTNGTYAWTFDDAGNLNLPNNGDINFAGGGIVQTPDEDFIIRVQDADDDGFAVQQQVDDGAGSVLGSTDLQRDRFIVQFAGGSSPQFRFTDIGQLEIPGNIRATEYVDTSLYSVSDNSDNGSVELKVISYMGDVLGSNVRVTQSNAYISTNNALYTWNFDNTGNLNLPLSGNLVGTTPNNNGYLSWFGNSSGDNNGYTTLRLVPDDTRESADQYLIIDPTAPGHIHIRAGGTQDNSSADLFLGGENSYFRVGPGPNPATFVTANSYVWEFGTAGTFNLPGDNVASAFSRITSLGNSSGDGNGYTTLSLIPDINLTGSDQYLIIDPTAPGHIHIRAGGTQDNSSADLFLGGENSYFKVPAGANTEVQVTSNSNTWTFGTDGVLTTPGGISIDGDITGTGSVELQAAPNGNAYVNLDDISDSYIGSAANLYLLADSDNREWIFDTSGTLTTPGDITVGGDITGRAATSTLVIKAQPDSNTYIQLNNTVDSEIRTAANLEIITDASNTSQTWTFTTDGTLTLPGATAFVDASADFVGIYADASQNNGIEVYTNADTNIFNAGNVNIYANVAGSPVKTWTFANTGDLTAPGNISATRLQNDGNLEIRSNVAGTARTWTFDTLGDFNMPVGGNISGSGGISANNITLTGNISANTAGFALGYRDIPQVAFTGNATIAAADAGKHFYSTESTDYVLTIADNSAVSWPVGTAITVVNRGTGNITVAQASGVSLYLAGNSTAGNRTVSTYGMVTLLNVAANVWMINGTGVA